MRRYRPGAVPTLGPRVVVAGTHSGVGKTTVTTSLLAALRAAGHRSAGADAIDAQVDLARRAAVGQVLPFRDR